MFQTSHFRLRFMSFFTLFLEPLPKATFDGPKCPSRGNWSIWEPLSGRRGCQQRPFGPHVSPKSLLFVSPPSYPSLPGTNLRPKGRQASSTPNGPSRFGRNFRATLSQRHPQIEFPQIWELFWSYFAMFLAVFWQHTSTQTHKHRNT